MLKILFPVLIVLVSLLSISCSRKNQGNNGKTVFKYNESAGITSLDPAFARNQANIWAVNQLFNGLVQLDDSLKTVPCIARKWEISNDGLTYTFKLRSDVYFHNSSVFPEGKGRKVSASDFVYSFNRIMDPKVASPGAWIFGQVLKQGEKYAFEAPNDSIFILKLSKPFPPFLGLLCMQYCSVVPHEAVEYYGADFRQHPVGTGPFYFKLWKEGVKLVLLKNPAYFEFESGKRLPFLDAVAVTFIVDKQSAFLEFIKGNLDFMSGIDASYKDEMLTKAGNLNPKYNNRIFLIKHPYLNTEYLGILCDKKSEALQGSPLGKKPIRQAMNCGFDRVKMMQYLRNNIGIPGTAGFVPSGIPWFDQSRVKGYTYDPVKARQLLAEAGYPGGKGLPAITLSTNASYLDLCKYIQSQLNEIGFNIKIDVSPPATLREMIAQSKILFFRGSWIADYPEAENYLSLFYTANFCPAGPNYTHYSNPEFDHLYAKSISILDDSARAGYYVQMDNLLMKDAPVIVLYYDQVLRFTTNKISNLGCNALNLLNLKKVRKTND
ncbi:MAG: ABC transporter substrate-binding protein [Bacteroidetes bacterium]|nr:ABC transporter substrate-binding protein [Bacteroidota bacterium]